jgi:hypothetical protein
MPYTSISPNATQQRNTKYPYLLRHPRDRHPLSQLNITHPRTRLPTTNTPPIRRWQDFTTLPNHRPRHPPHHILLNSTIRPKCRRHPLRSTPPLQRPAARESNLHHNIHHPPLSCQRYQPAQTRHQNPHRNKPSARAHLPPAIMVRNTINIEKHAGLFIRRRKTQEHASPHTLDRTRRRRCLCMVYPIFCVD